MTMRSDFVRKLHISKWVLECEIYDEVYPLYSEKDWSKFAKLLNMHSGHSCLSVMFSRIRSKYI